MGYEYYYRSSTCERAGRRQVTLPSYEGIAGGGRGQVYGLTTYPGAVVFCNDASLN